MAGLAFAMGFASTATLVAVNFTTAINANVVNAGQPATTALVAWILLRERLTTAQVVGVTAAVMGILVMVSRADWAMVMGLGINGGDLWMCISIIGYAVYATGLLAGQSKPFRITLDLFEQQGRGTSVGTGPAPPHLGQPPRNGARLKVPIHFLFNSD